MAKKRVLIISLDYYPGEVGGAEVAIKAITDRISPEEIEFHMVTLHYDKTMTKVEQLGNVLVHRIGFGWKNPTIANRRKFPLHYNKHLFQFTAALKAMLLHRRYCYDGIWAMMAHSCGVPAAIFKLLNPKVKYVLTLQEGDPPEHIERMARPLWPLFVRAFTKADTIQVISNFLGRWARRIGYQGEPVLVPNAVNTAHFAHEYTREAVAAIHEKLGKRTGDVFLITTSRLVQKNGVDVVIRALPLLPETVHFVIYGNGPDEAKLKALAGELGVAHRTHFNGLIGHDVMPLYLKACDIFIRPSRSEGMGNSFIEAMAAGIPVIATQEGGIADFLFDAKRNPNLPTTGWAVTSESAEEIRDAVRDIIAHPERVREVTKTARERVLATYDWGHIARAMKEQVFDPTLK